MDPHGRALPRLRAVLNPPTAVFVIDAVSAWLTARSQLLASCAYLCTMARSTGQAKSCRRRGGALVRERGGEEGKSYGDWREPTSSDLGSETLDGVACGRHGRGWLATAPVPGSEAGGRVRENVRLPGSCRRAAAGTRKAEGATLRGREHALKREASAGNPHAGFDARGEETWSRRRLRHRHDGESRRNQLALRPRQARLSSALLAS